MKHDYYPDTKINLQISDKLHGTVTHEAPLSEMTDCRQSFRGTTQELATHLSYFTPLIWKARFKSEISFEWVDDEHIEAIYGDSTLPDEHSVILHLNELPLNTTSPSDEQIKASCERYFYKLLGAKLGDVSPPVTEETTIYYPHTSISIYLSDLLSTNTEIKVELSDLFGSSLVFSSMSEDVFDKLKSRAIYNYLKRKIQPEYGYERVDRFIFRISYSDNLRPDVKPIEHEIDIENLSNSMYPTHEEILEGCKRYWDKRLKTEYYYELNLQAEPNPNPDVTLNPDQPKPDSGVTFKPCYDNTIETHNSGSSEVVPVKDILTHYPYGNLTLEEFHSYDEHNRADILQDCCEAYWDSVSPSFTDSTAENQTYANIQRISYVVNHPVLQKSGCEGTMKNLYIVNRSNVGEASFSVTPVTDEHGNLCRSTESCVVRWDDYNKFIHLDYTYQTYQKDWTDSLPKTETQLHKLWFAWVYNCVAKAKNVSTELPGFKSKHRGGTKGYWYDVASEMKVRLSN